MPSERHEQKFPVSSYGETKTTGSLSNGVWTVSHQVTSVAGSQSSTNKLKLRNWTRTPNYQALRRAGALLPDNPTSLTLINDGHLFGGVVTYSSNSPSSWIQFQRDINYQNVYIPDVVSNPWTASSHGFKLLKKAKGSEWLAPVFFAELGKTSGMVARSAVRLANMMISLKKGNFTAFVRLWHPSARERLASKRSFERQKRHFQREYGRTPTKAVASAWLEYKYGWTPFVLDVYNAFETLSDFQDTNPRASIGSVRSNLKASSEQVLTSPDRITALAGVLVGGKIVVTHKISSRAVWRYSVKDDLNSIGKVGLTNPLIVAWELVPLSFVADWFLPIGDYLASLDAPMRLQHVGGTIGFRQDSRSHTMILSTPKGYTVSPSSFKSGHRFENRVQAITGFPSPRLKDVAFSANLKHGRAFSAIALLSSVFGGKR